MFDGACSSSPLLVPCPSALSYIIIALSSNTQLPAPASWRLSSHSKTKCLRSHSKTMCWGLIEKCLPITSMKEKMATLILTIIIPLAPDLDWFTTVRGQTERSELSWAEHMLRAEVWGPGVRHNLCYPQLGVSLYLGIITNCINRSTVARVLNESGCWRGEDSH